MSKFLKNLLWVFVFIMSLVAGTVNAQDIYVDSAKVRITTGTFLVNTRNVVVVDSGIVNNSGAIFVSGNITNTSGRINSDGREVLNGASDQTIAGVHGTSNLGNVVRSQSANTNIIAGSNVTMRNFDFGSTNGFFRSTVLDRAIRILNPVDTAIKNFSSTKYFDLGDNLGILERAIATLDTLIFPVGNDSLKRLNYHPMNSQSGFVGIKVIKGLPYSGTLVPADYVRVYSSGFGNSLTGSGCVSDTFNADVMFDCLTPDYWRLITPTSTAEYFVEVFNPACFDQAVGVGNRRVLRLPGTTPGNDWFLDTNVENVVDLPITDNFCLYSDWRRNRDTILGGIYRDGGLLAIASGVFYPLSVELTRLTATAEKTEIVLNWETATEKNADRFDVMRSTDVVNFKKIGSVYATGNSNTPRDYQFIDDNVEPGIEYYYQLHQVDYDEQFTLSNVVSARISGSSSDNSELLVYPNPTTGLLRISQVVDQVLVLTITGQQVGYYQNINSVSLDQLPAGMYILQVKNQQGSKNFKVQKQ